MNKKDVKSKDKLLGIPNADQQFGNDNKLFHFLIEDSALPILFLSSDGVVTYANQSFTKMIGYSYSEIMEKDAFLFFNYRYEGDSKRRIFIDTIKSLRCEEKALEIQFCKKSGELCWVSIESLTHRRDLNNNLLIQCVLKDTTKERTQRIETEKLLEATKEKAKIFANLIENMDAHIAIRKVDNTIVWANKLFLELYDSSLEGIVGKTELNLWSVEETKKIEDARIAVMQNRKRNTIELFIEHKGTKFTVLMTQFPIFNKFDAVEYIGEIKHYNQSRPLKSEQKWACAGPLCTRRMLSVFFDNAPNPIYATDIDGRLIEVNQAFVDIYGTSKEELYDKSKEEVDTLFGINEGEVIIKADHHILESGQNIELECDIFHPASNKVMHFNFNKFPLHSFDGKIYGVGTIMTDRTQIIEHTIELENTKHDAELYKLKSEYHEYLLQSYMDNVPYYASIINLEGKFEFVNQYALNLWGDTKENITNRHFTAVIKNEHFLGHIVQGMEFVLNEHRAVENEEVLILPDNDNIIFLTNIFPLFNATGGLFAIGIFRVDITKRKQVERERELWMLETLRTQGFLSSLIDHIPLPVFYKDANCIYTGVNQAFCQFWGKTKEEIIGKTVFDLNIDRALADKWHEKDIDLLHNQTEQVYEYLSPSFDGSIRDVIYRKNVFYSPDGKLGGIIGVIQDITDFKQAEQEREQLLTETQKQQALLRTIIDCAPDFISIKDLEHRYIMANMAFANAMHLTTSDFTGKNDLELGFPEELVKGNPEKGITGFWEDNQRVMNSGQIHVIPNEPSVIEGVERTFVATKTPLKNTDGQVWGVLTFSHDITNKLQQQEALRLAKERFQSLYNSTPAMLYSINTEGEITTVSDYWLEVMGYTREEVIGQKLSRFVTAESLQYSREVVWPLFIKNGNCFNEEFQFIKKNGTIITCLLSAIAERNNDGLFVGSLEVLVDITELKMKEVEIADSKRLLNDFIDNIPYSAMILDLEQRYVIINDNTAKLYSATKEELIGLNYADRLTFPENKKQLNEIYTYVLKHKKRINITWQLRSSDGETISVMTDTFPIYNSSNEFTHIGSIVVDITDKVKREEELIAAQQASETSKQLLKSFMDNATSAMFAKDENGTYIITNKKKEEYESLREFSRLNPDLDPVQFYNSELSRIDDARVITQNTAMTFYDRLLGNDGSVIYTETVKFPIYDKHSGLIGVGGITKDITEIVIREKELEEARQKAEDAANSQERFLASMSHDMRTPLNGVVGMINLLEQTSLSAEQKEYMEAMKVSSYNLRVLINDILDISKIQAGKLNIEYVLFDLNEILTSVNNVFSHEASRKGVLFSVELPSDTPVMLEGDPSRLSQILNNLIGNALKFTAEGFVKLKLQHEKLADDKVNIKFTIEDSGIGISEEGLGKLFQPFVQASSDTTRKFGGSGLGLSICKSLVELQQGEIGVNSTLGKGSIFYFSIPYTKAKQVRIGQTKQKNNATELISAQPLPPMRCLVFEDNMINQKVAFHTLKKVGVRADMANNGKVGIEILRKDPILYDFVLMDIQMPEMDGYEATTVIRNELGLKVPIIAMTASALKGEKEHCIEVGMNDFVPKPFVIDELLYVIRRLIRKGQEEEITPQLADEVTDNTSKSEAIKYQAGFGDEPLYDMTNVLEMEDDDFTLEILNTFLDTVPNALEELKTGITQTNDWDTVTKVAHKLKGGVGVLQMNEMIKQLATIEINSKCRENLDQLPEAVDVCCQIYDVVKDEITKLRDETKTKM